ncbi:MAG: nucleoside hydrolase [Chloroflexi bacterium]|nr:nucleoside hydrolase [Chloroflexota bacterium]
MTGFPRLAEQERLARLEPPRGPVSMVLDTDTYNEIDDQFALVYALLSSNLRVEAVYAAPFHNARSTGPGDGMEKSYEEILRILDRLGYGSPGLVWRGSAQYLPSITEPVESEAANDLIAKAMMTRRGPLYVVAIGAITNVASALLMEPEIARHIVVVWLGGQPYYWPTAREFNLQKDVPAAQVVFNSGVPLVHIPAKNVSEHLRTTLPELQVYLEGRGAIGEYLLQIFREYHEDQFAYSKVIWDISGVAYLNNPDWVPTQITPAPILWDDITWGGEDPTRHMVRVAYDVNRDAIFGDLFRKIAAHAKRE